MLGEREGLLSLLLENDRPESRRCVAGAIGSHWRKSDLCKNILKAVWRFLSEHTKCALLEL